MSIRILLAILLTAFLAACSGATSDIDPDFQNPDPGDPGSPVVIPGGLRILFNATSLDAGAFSPDQGVEVRAIATSAGNATVPGVRIAFSSDSGLVVVGETLTDELGAAVAILTTGGDPSVRLINVTASVPGSRVTATAQIPVAPPDTSGPQIANVNLISSASTLSSDAVTAANGLQLTAIVTDARGNLLPAAPVTFSLQNPNAALQIVDRETQPDGTAKAILTTGGDPTQRTVTVLARAGSVTKPLTVTVGPIVNPSEVVDSIILTSDKPSLQANDTTFASGAVITAVAVNAQGQIIVGAPVSLTVAGGAAIQAGATQTDSSGQVVAALSNGGNGSPRTLTVTARSGSATSTLQVPVAAAPTINVASINLEPDRETLAPGDSTPDRALTLSAIPVDSRGRALVDVVVSFSIQSGGGALLPTNNGLTDASGIARARLTTGGSSTPRNIVVVASVGNVVSTRTIQVAAAPSPLDRVAAVQISRSSATLEQTASNLAAGVTISGAAVDSGGRTIEGVPVDFVVTSGNGTLTVTKPSTDNSGPATAILTTGGNPTPRTITITATTAGRTASLTVAVADPNADRPPPASALLRSSRPQLFTDENTFASGVALTAQVLDASGVAVENANVSFTIVSGGGALSAGTVKSDQMGAATVLLHAGTGQPRNIVLRASAGGTAVANLTIPVQVRNQSSNVTRLVIAAPSSILSPTQATPQTGLVLTVTALDAGSAPVPEAPVTFSITSGDGVITPNGLQTDGQGTITASLSTGGNPAPRTIVVRATAGTVTQSATYTVQAQQLSLTLIASSPTLPSAAQIASDGVNVTAVVTNQNNVRQPGVPVSFSATSGSILTSASQTDSNGEVDAILTTNGDPSPRVITVTATGASGTTSLDIPVTGTTLSSESPNNAGVGESFTVSLVLTDSNQSPLINRQVMLESALGNTVSPPSATTNNFGRAFFTVNALMGGPEVLTARALGITLPIPVAIQAFSLQFEAPAEDQEIPLGQAAPVVVRLLQNGQPASGRAIMLTSSRGTLAASTVTTGADGRASTTITSQGAGATGGAAITASVAGLVSTRSVEFVSVTPTSLLLRTDRNRVQVGESTPVTATVRDSLGNPVKNKTVTFQLQDPTLGSLAPLTLRTNALGQAVTTYTAGQTASAPNAVIVTATIPEAPSRTVRFTVGGQALRITLGTSNVIGSDVTNTVYELPYAAIVTDASGNPVPDVSVSFRVDSVSYQKGRYIEIVDAEGETTLRPAYRAEPQDGAFGCLNEDADRNGVLAMAEDFNNNGRLDPGNAASVQPSIATDQNGQSNVTVRYAKDFANWVRVTLSATAGVGGTESTETRTFTLPIARDDLDDPPGFISPFGESNACADPA